MDNIAIIPIIVLHRQFLCSANIKEPVSKPLDTNTLIIGIVMCTLCQGLFWVLLAHHLHHGQRQRLLTLLAVLAQLRAELAIHQAWHLQWYMITNQVTL